MNIVKVVVGGLLLAAACGDGNGLPVEAAAEPEPTAAEPEPTAAEPEPTAAEPEPTAAEPEPSVAEPEPTAVEPAPNRSSFAFSVDGSVWALDLDARTVTKSLTVNGLPLDGRGEIPDPYVSFAVWDSEGLTIGLCCEPIDGGLWVVPVSAAAVGEGTAQRTSLTALDLSIGASGKVLAVRASEVLAYEPAPGGTVGEQLWSMPAESLFGLSEGTWIGDSQGSVLPSDGSGIVVISDGSVVASFDAPLGACYQRLADGVFDGQIAAVLSEPCWSGPHCCGTNTLVLLDVTDNSEARHPIGVEGVMSMTAAGEHLVMVDGNGDLWTWNSAEGLLPFPDSAIEFTAVAGAG